MERTHVVTIVARTKGAKDSRGRPAGLWENRQAGVKANLQPRSGKVQQGGSGRAVEATWQGFIPPGIAIDEDNGIEVTSGVGPARFLVVQVGELGQGFDTEILLEETRDPFTRPA